MLCICHEFDNWGKCSFPFTIIFYFVLTRWIVQLLAKDPLKRLGSGAGGAQEIMNHPFFENLDWDRIARQEIEAIYKPIAYASTSI